MVVISARQAMNENPKGCQHIFVKATGTAAANGYEEVNDPRKQSAIRYAIESFLRIGWLDSMA